MSVTTKRGCSCGWAAHVAGPRRDWGCDANGAAKESRLLLLKVMSVTTTTRKVGCDFVTGVCWKLGLLIM
jgi:hypothetical protein